MRITPPHLQPVLSRVKRFVERMPEGATLTQISLKVQAYSLLNKGIRRYSLALSATVDFWSLRMMEELQRYIILNLDIRQ
ncbi:hypothetical protein EC12741_5525 [Escherichia coli 1.2741]|nr:hypothetical protein EC12741_5525 [Escherichia coli 1.2741]